MQLSFGDFTLDRDRRLLLRRGDTGAAPSPVPLTPKAFLLLEALLVERPRALAKEELFARLWAGAFVTDASLSVVVAALRRALDDDARRPRFVRTVHGFGYAWCGEVEGGDAVESSPLRAGGDEPTRPSTCCLRWGRREIPLTLGENLLGRDPGARVVIDDPGVSRRHARVVVTGEGATLEDLGSKNGTRLNGARLASPIALADGDAIVVGPVTLVYRSLARQASTLTRRG